LPHLPAGLNGEGDGRFAANLKAENGMGNQRRSPIIHKQVHSLDLVEVNGARQPLAAVVELSAIVAIPKVMDGYDATMDVSPGGFRLVDPPLFIVRGPKSHPPGQDREEAKHPSYDLPPGPPSKAIEKENQDQPINNRG
jgi:hypothetical protein